MKTFAQILAIVQEFTRINPNDTNLTTLCTNAIDIAYYGLAREQRWPELLVLRTSLTLTGSSGGTLIAVPDHIGVEEVKYNNLSPLKSWELAEKNSLVPPAPIYNKPRAYQIVQGVLATPTQYRMSVEPYDGIAAGDTIWFSYFMVPALFSTAVVPNLVTSSNWENELIMRAQHYVLTYMGKTDEAAEIWKEVLGRMAHQSNETQTTT